MKSIGGLLRRGRPGERAEFSAAFVLGAVNDVLGAVLEISPADAKAISFQYGIVIIGVSHGAVAGTVQQSSEKLVADANKKIQASGGQPNTIRTIRTRPMVSPLP